MTRISGRVGFNWVINETRNFEGKKKKEEEKMSLPVAKLLFAICKEREIESRLETDVTGCMQHILLTAY